jgi:uncharacterized protein
MEYARAVRASHLRQLVHTVLNQFALAPAGEHGAAHWARVLENGTRLAALTGANRAVVELFAVLHDARRLSDVEDPEHGWRAAEYAAALRGTHYHLDDAEFELLWAACEGHAHGMVDGDTTVQTCWDADRLDLGRGGIVPDPRLLCTAAARNQTLIGWATERARRDRVPPFVQLDWGIDLQFSSDVQSG